MFTFVCLHKQFVHRDSFCKSCSKGGLPSQVFWHVTPWKVCKASDLHHDPKVLKDIESHAFDMFPLILTYQHTPSPSGDSIIVGTI